LLNASSNPDYKNAVQDLIRAMDELQGAISYDADKKVLRFAGAMTTRRRNRLNALPADANYQGAISSLFNPPRRFVSRNMRSFSLQTFRQGLTITSDVLKEALRNSPLNQKVYYDATDKELRFIGAMTEAERDALLALPSDAAYQTAVNMLF